MCTATANQQLRRRGQLNLLGHSRVEQSRLKRQAEELRQESNSLFDRVGLRSGGRAIDIGCGPQGVLDLLSERVGSTGLVVGIERDDKSVAAARQFAAGRALKNVKVLQGDAAAVGLPGDIFDLVHARLVLVNIPNAESGRRRNGPIGPSGWDGRQPRGRLSSAPLRSSPSSLGPSFPDLPRLLVRQRHRPLYWPPHASPVP